VSKSVWSGKVSVANPNRDGTGTLVTIVTGGANGSVVEFVRLKAQETVTDGMIRVFLDDGVGSCLYHEVPVYATTASATQMTFEVDYEPIREIYVPNGFSLKFSTEKGETFDIAAYGEDL
jgi:hypothetical protein